MKQDTYRYAYEEANAELREILSRFEQLRLRKAQMEQAVEALRPLVAEAPATASDAETLQAADPAPFLVEQQKNEAPAAEPVPEPVAAGAASEPELEESSDPFQRRIDNALRHGFGARDSRVLSLGLNSLLTRA